MNRLFLGLCLFAAACAPDRFDLKLAGPTLMEKGSGGYTLSNRELLVTLSEKTGDVTYWGTADRNENFLLAPVTAHLTSEPDASPPDGYIEKRDDQTWQFIGIDGKNIRWRKIYCLEGRSLYVTYLVENLNKTSVSGRIAVNHGLDNGGDAEAASGSGRAGGWSIQAFTEKHDAGTASAGEMLSDSFNLKPQERISMTMEWRFVPRR